jgi:hypothetical protein
MYFLRYYCIINPEVTEISDASLLDGGIYFFKVVIRTVAYTLEEEKEKEEIYKIQGRRYHGA